MDVCKTFEERADGYGRGEGCGVMFVKPLADALADGNRVYGVIAGSCVNQDGRSNVLTAPNGPAQEAVIAGAWADAGVSGRDVVYVEAHGTGTPLGDPIEMGALSNALEAAGVSGSGAVGVGAAKRVFGHTEAAAGMVGLIKCALSVWHGAVPGGVGLSGAVNELISVDGVLKYCGGEWDEWAWVWGGCWSEQLWVWRDECSCGCARAWRREGGWGGDEGSADVGPQQVVLVASRRCCEAV